MGTVDARLVGALREQLERRDALLRTGARRVGWKLGMSDGDRIGGEIGVGHLTSATCLPSGGTYAAGGDRELQADAEIVVELARAVAPTDDPDAVREAIARYGPAVEMCDVAPLPNEPHSVIATNDFHRAVSFGELRPSLPPGAELELVVDGAVRRSGPPPTDIPERLLAAARVLAALGERLETGDRIITSSVVSWPITAPVEVTARIGDFEPARLSAISSSAI